MRGLEALSSTPRLIAVTSGKGGVGKTNFTINLALALRERGKRVTILDADLGMANVNVALGLKAPLSLFDVLEGGRTLEEVIIEGPQGIRIIPGGSGIAELADLDESSRRRLIGQFDALAGQCDVLLIDTAAGLTKNVLAFTLAADTVVVITVPEPPAIADAYAVMKAILTADPRADLQLVVNRVQRFFEGKLVYDKLSLVVRRFLGASIGRLGSIVDDPAVGESIRRQRPFLLEFPDSEASRMVREMVPRLFMEYKGETRGLKGFIDSILGIFR